MSRVFIVTGWLVGLTVPALFATVFIFGCCVLPFHNVVHKLMPVCDFAAGLLRGGNVDQRDTPTMPAPEKEKAAKSAPGALGSKVRVATIAAEVGARPTAMIAVSIRNVVSLGAVRCDDDVGLHLLLTTFRI